MGTSSIIRIPRVNHLTETFTLPPDIIPSLSHYYLLHWDPEYFLSQSLDKIIIREGIIYAVILPAAPIGMWRKDRYIRLSFRKAKADQHGYVLARRIGNKQEPHK